MNPMLAPYTLNITGGTFTQVHGDAQCHGFRGPETSDILHRATATAAFHNSDERFDPPKCHPNTRLAVLTTIMKWIKWEEGIDAFIMWVYGPAGAGKSAIAQTIAEMCEEDMILLASFFFSRSDPSRSTVKPLVATIAYQITSNLPQTRDIILGAIERDPLIFTKSLAVQVKSLIVRPLQSLSESGFFDHPTSRHLIIIDGLDECFDPNVQRNIVEVLANSQRQHQLPLIFLFSSRPERHISFAFSTGVLPSVTTRIALDGFYHPDEDITLFLTDKFQEIRSTHPLRAYIPLQWPPHDVLKRLVRKSSGQFVYASTIIRYVSSIRHKPTDRLDIVLGIRPAQRDLPFQELDALYTHILAGAEDIERVLEILSVMILNVYPVRKPTLEIFLSLQPGDVELYLGDLESLINHEPNHYIRILHASLPDFLVDPTRSKTFWINPRARHAAFARRCLQILQLKEAELNVDTLLMGYWSLVHHLDYTEMTPELYNDLINFSFDCIQDVLKEREWLGSIHIFSTLFLECLERLRSPEANHVSQNFQVSFDTMLLNALEKYYPFSGFTLLVGSILQYRNFEHPPFLFPPGQVASLYLARQEGEGDILDDMGFCGISAINAERPGTTTFLIYFIELLENPERSGTRAFDQHRYAAAAKECLQLCLCSHHKFSKGATQSTCRDRVLLRSKPWAWKARLGIHSRIRNARKYLTVRQWRSLKARKHTIIHQYASFPPSSSKYEYSRHLSYQWRLDLLPVFLENSAISLELVDVLRRRTFTTMAQRFPQRMKLAREAITTYLLRADFAVGGP